MREIFLHIGHAKTASSFIQESLYFSKDKLLDVGVLYPIKDCFFKGSYPNASGGNGRGLLKAHEDISFWTERTEGIIFDRLLYSDEWLFEEIYRNSFLKNNFESLLAKGFERIRIILFVRNPVELVKSFYQQSVKRRGLYIPICEYCKDFNYYERVYTVINRIRSLGLVDLTIKNYSTEKNNLTNIIETWLGVESSVIGWAESSVNTSLSREEVEFLRLLNRFYQGKHTLFDGEPEEKIENSSGNHRFELNSEAYRNLVRTVYPQIEKLNSILPESAQVALEENTAFDDSNEYVFTRRQIEIITRVLWKKN